MEGIYLLLGTNLGNRTENLLLAQELIGDQIGVIQAISPIYQTAAWGLENQPDFLNQVIKIDTPLQPEELLQRLLQLETQMGRVRRIKWGERLIDLDILYYHNQTIHTQTLQVPHPGIPNRRFTLIPLVDICPEATHPVLGLKQRQLLEQCQDPLPVSIFPKQPTGF